MNQFTKDELELIHDGLSYAAGASKSTGGMMIDILFPISRKIKFMIDNYCDHDYKETYNEETYFICEKCGDRDI